MKTWFLGFIIPLISHLTHEERDLRNHRSLIQQQNKKIDQKKIIKTEAKTDKM